MSLPQQTFSTIGELLTYVNTYIVPNANQEIIGTIHNNVENALANFIVSYTLNSGLAQIISSGGDITLTSPVNVITNMVPSSVQWVDNVQNEYYILNSTNLPIPLGTDMHYFNFVLAVQTSIPANTGIHIAKATNGEWVQIGSLDAGGSPTPVAARNGLSVDSAGYLVFGNPVGASPAEAMLDDDREIPLNNFSIAFRGSNLKQYVISPDGIRFVDGVNTVNLSMQNAIFQIEDSGGTPYFGFQRDTKSFGFNDTGAFSAFSTDTFMAFNIGGSARNTGLDIIHSGMSGAFNGVRVQNEEAGLSSETKISVVNNGNRTVEFGIGSSSFTNFPNSGYILSDGDCLFISNVHDVGSLRFGVGTGAGFTTEKMRLFSNGNFIINSPFTDEGQNFQVNGTGRITSVAGKGLYVSATGDVGIGNGVTGLIPGGGTYLTLSPVEPNNFSIIEIQGNQSFQNLVGSITFVNNTDEFGRIDIENTSSVTGSMYISTKGVGGLSTLISLYEGKLVRLGSGTQPVDAVRLVYASDDKIDVTADYRMVDIFANVTLDTTSSILTSYSANFVNLCTRSIGGNPLTNVGIYAKAADGDVNYAAIFDGDVVINGQVKITGGSPANGNVLISDAEGLASWQSPPFWSLTGNNVVNGLHFIGSLNNAPVSFKVNNSERMRMTLAGVMIGASANVAQAPLHVRSQAGGVGVGSGFPFGLQLLLQNNLGTDNPCSLCLIAGADASASIFFGYSAGATIGNIQFDCATNSLSFFVQSIQALIIDNLGQIIIPTGSPAAGKVLTSDANGVASWQAFSLKFQATLNFGSTAAGQSSDLTFPAPGAAVGNPVALGVPATAVLTNSCYTAWVSSPDTVTIRFNNYSSGPLDPSSADFNVAVFI